jgi:hypothetical protein
MAKKIAIIQSNYIPWKGYFDLMNMADEFIFYDEVQYTKNDWRNRNKILTRNGSEWITLPIRKKKLQLIKDTKVEGNRWMKKHWASIQQNYSKAKYFNKYKDIFEELYLNCNDNELSKINYRFINAINKILNIETKLRWSNEFCLRDGKSEKILGICEDCGANIYLSGPSAKSYLDLNIFTRNNIKIEWINYSNYSVYQQVFEPFDHNVTILDLIFNEGDNAYKFMKSFK